MSIDLAKLKKAIEKVETGSGRNNYPRVEVAYLPVGERFTVQGRILVGTGSCVNTIVLNRYRALSPDDRLASAASWGPWQMLYHTAVDLGFTGKPADLHKREIAEPFVDKLLNKIAASGAETVEQFADAWNSGNWRDLIFPREYMAAVEAAYKELV